MKWVPSVVPEHPQQTNGDPLDQAAYEELKEELTALLQGKEKELFLRFVQSAEAQRLQYGEQQYRQGSQDTAQAILEDLEGCLGLSDEAGRPRRLI